MSPAVHPADAEPPAEPPAEPAEAPARTRMRRPPREPGPRGRAVRGWAAAAVIGAVLLAVGGGLLWAGVWVGRAAWDEFRAVLLGGQRGTITIAECFDPGIESPVQCTGDFRPAGAPEAARPVTLTGSHRYAAGTQVTAVASGPRSDTVYTTGRWAWNGWLGLTVLAIFLTVAGLFVLSPVLLTAGYVLRPRRRRSRTGHAESDHP